MSSRILILPALQELEEFLGPPFLKEPHERTPHCLHLGTGNLRNLTIAVDETASDLLEFEIASDVGVDEDASEFT